MPPIRAGIQSDREQVRDKWVANHWIEVSEDLEQDVTETERIARMLYYGNQS